MKMLDLARPLPERPSRVPLVLALAGVALTVWGATLPWMYINGLSDRPISGLGGGWVTAHATLRWGEYGFRSGADAWLTIAVALAGVALAALNLRRREQRLDRLQFACGALIALTLLYNWSWIEAFAGQHMVHSDPGGDTQDRAGAGMAVTLLAAIVTSAGALLGNTPEYTFGAAPRAEDASDGASSGAPRMLD